ncbi:hypothetical protein EVAR_87424_1 [Eumeta japonica]|uniref:Uncharacterized protein n=1 Tax=Eumeta variegata TaxID=151549 RepID=A0A4C1XJ82_EUMVA|nr:hypothetical protein EVAR_87424_1 [Eumeta japonica]
MSTQSSVDIAAITSSTCIPSVAAAAGSNSRRDDVDGDKMCVVGVNEASQATGDRLQYEAVNSKQLARPRISLLGSARNTIAHAN